MTITIVTTTPYSVLRITTWWASASPNKIAMKPTTCINISEITTIIKAGVVISKNIYY
jgi:hypothetical protein